MNEKIKITLKYENLITKYRINDVMPQHKDYVRAIHICESYHEEWNRQKVIFVVSEKADLDWFHWEMGWKNENDSYWC